MLACRSRTATTQRRPLAVLLAVVGLAGLATPGPSAAAPPSLGASAPFRDVDVPVEYSRLPNGLKVVLSPDRTAPVATVGVYYHVGSRIEPPGQSGFAHLFEHMMFQGSKNLGKGEHIRLVQSNGGTYNGVTMDDHTYYFETVPAHFVRPVLWAEADRMRGLALTEENLANQREVVKNEIRLNVLNRPYAGFSWLDLPALAFQNWHNGHNVYGEPADIDAATLDAARTFFDTHYAPNNAALVVVGDFDVARTKQWIDLYFGDIEPAPPPSRPDVSEPRQEGERVARRRYPRAPRPAIAVGYHAPDRETPEYLAFDLIDEILGEGPDARLHQRLVLERGVTGEVSTWVRGNRYEVEGPTLYMIELRHDSGIAPEAILEVIDAEISRLRDEPVDAATLERARIKAKSWFFDELERGHRLGRANLLGTYALFFDAPERVNEVPEGLHAVTPELIQRTAQEYLRTSNRTVLIAEAGEGR